MKDNRELTTLQVKRATKDLINEKKLAYTTKKNRGVRLTHDDFLRLVMEDLKV